MSLKIYDEAGNLKASLGKDERTFYGYDSEDRLTKAYGDGNRFASYEYDAAGNVTEKRIRRLVSTYRYDPTGRITSARETAYAGKIPEGFDPSLVREHYRVRQAFGKGWQDDFPVPAETTYRYDQAGNLAREITRNTGAGLRVEKRYGHDGLGRLTEVVAEGGAVRHFAYDGLDRKVFSGRRGGNLYAYGTLALYDGRRNVYEQDSQGKKHGTRTWLPLDEELTGEVLHRSVAGGNPEFVSREHLPDRTESMSMHVNRLGSTVFAADRYGKALIKYGYSEFGEVYVRKRGLGGRFVPRTARVPEEVLNRETVNRLYTGGTQEQLSGLVHLDARHYSPAKTKFVQPDPYSLTELSLPEEARHTLVKAAGLTLEGLLADPAQQLGNSYVSNNPLRWVDPLGLFGNVRNDWDNWGGSGESGRPSPARRRDATSPTGMDRYNAPYGEARDNGPHRGLDFDAENYGDDARASKSGRVTFTRSDGSPEGKTNGVRVTNTDGTDSYYGHVSPSVKAGEWVNRGDRIGKVDESGLSTGPHVHYEARDKPFSRGGKHYDPIDDFSPRPTRGNCR